jgi:hypothetical protein
MGRATTQSEVEGFADWGCKVARLPETLSSTMRSMAGILPIKGQL